MNKTKEAIKELLNSVAEINAKLTELGNGEEADQPAPTPAPTPDDESITLTKDQNATIQKTLADQKALIAKYEADLKIKQNQGAETSEKTKLLKLFGIK